MENLSLDQFNPTVTELTVLADKYKSLTISGVDDRVGYEVVKAARIELKNTRVDIEKKGKLLRDDANKFAKAVIAKEKELISIIEPTEQDLMTKQEAIDNEKERLARVKLLPERKEKLATINLVIPDDLLLTMDNGQFMEFFNGKHNTYLEAQALRLKEEKEKFEAAANVERNRLIAEKLKLESDRLKLEDDKKHQAELEQARKEAAANATADALRKAKEDEAERFRKTQEALENGKKLEAEKIETEKTNLEKLNKKKEYQEFLDKHGYAEDGTFLLQKEGSKMMLYKRLGYFALCRK